MLERKRSALSLGRMSLKSTSASADHDPRIDLRNRVRRIRDSLRRVFRVRRSLSERRDYFTGELPPEIRLLIYKEALRFDAPIFLERNPKHGFRTKLAGILSVSRLTYKEALPILHDLNTISISREELCRFPTGQRPQLTCKPEMLQSLHIRDLAPSARCAARTSNASVPPCTVCHPSLLGLIHSLTREPRLRKVCLDYHDHFYAVRGLIEGLRGMPFAIDHTIQVHCTGIGKYELAGSLTGNLNITMRNVPLLRMWTRILASPGPPPYIPFFQAHRGIWRDIKSQEKGADRQHLMIMALKLMALVMNHDAGFIPASFTINWPPNLPMDLRTVDVAAPGLLHGLNVQLEEYLVARLMVAQDLVPRP